MRFIILFNALLFLSNLSFSGEAILLKGVWNVALDRGNISNLEHWSKLTFKDTITLPGTLVGAGYGTPVTTPDYGRLTPTYKYIGKAWYQRKVLVPYHWKSKRIRLLLERVLWESTVYIDGKEISRKDALGSPHLHDLGPIAPGEHTLTICVNNEMIYNIGDKGHAYGEYTQTIWNGVLGRIELLAEDHAHIESVRVHSDVRANTVTARIKLANFFRAEHRTASMTLRDRTEKIIAQRTYTLDSATKEFHLVPSVELERWSEFTPTLYTLELSVEIGKYRSSKRVRFGFREVSATNRHILLNYEPIFLRGNNDCGIFPLLGYPDTDIASWRTIFERYKAYGLNHVRFHSWCPPEAAFEAADEVGIYIQAEASAWIDSWMEADMRERGRDELFTKGKPRGLGRGDLGKDEFIRRELENMVQWYGNHPSLIMVGIGNELGSSDFHVLGEWIRELKAANPGRLYAASTARQITPYCDYTVTHEYPSIGQVRQRMFNHNNWDYGDKFSQVAIPTIAHEIGQWPTHPVWAENAKYHGNLRAWNLDLLEKLAKQRGVHQLDSQFRLASGKLAMILYKDEIESYLRTPSVAGFQLLGMQDYTGQGEALIGWLDAFYDEKGIIAPSDFKQFCNDVVPLVKLDTYSLTEGQAMNVPVLLYQYASASITGDIRWDLKDVHGSVLASGSLGKKIFENGHLHQVGMIYAVIPDDLANTEIALHVWVEGTEYANSWPLWVFPSESDSVDSDEIVITHEFDEHTKRALAAGRKVLLIANHLGAEEHSVPAAWKPLYWSATFFPGQGIQTIGTLIQHEHPLFGHFPTSYHSDWQWWNIAAGGYGFLLNDFPATYMPIVAPISDFHFSDRIGSIFEVVTGGGRLLVCGYDISEANQSIEAKQLRYSILKYMESDRFNPEVSIDFSKLGEWFQRSGNRSEVTLSADVLLSVLPGPEADEQHGYHKSMDKVLIGDPGSYKLYNVNYLKDGRNVGWAGKDIRLIVSVPQGLLGNLSLVFSKIGVDCSIKIENRRYQLPHTDEVFSLPLSFMREDTQEGQIVMEVEGEVVLRKFEVFAK